MAVTSGLGPMWWWIEMHILSISAGFTVRPLWDTPSPAPDPICTGRAQAVFSSAFPCQAHISSYGGMWGFALASQKLNPLHLPPMEIDRTISARMKRGLRFYDGTTHQGMFSLPKHLRQAIDEEKRIITEEEPLFIYEP